MHSTVPSRYTVRILPNRGSGARFELFDTRARRGVKSYLSHAHAISDMTFLNTLLAAHYKGQATQRVRGGGNRSTSSRDETTRR